MKQHPAFTVRSAGLLALGISAALLAGCSSWQGGGSNSSSLGAGPSATSPSTDQSSSTLRRESMTPNSGYGPGTVSPYGTKGGSSGSQ